MFSFDLVVRLNSTVCTTSKLTYSLQCIYAMTKRVVLAVADEERPEGSVLQDLVVERQLSYFTDYEGVCGLVKYFRGKPKGQYFAIIAKRFTKDNPRLSFDTLLRRSRRADDERESQQAPHSYTGAVACIV